MTNSEGFHCVGLDLAWGMTARTGVAVVASDGHLVASASVVHDPEIRDFLRPYADSIRTAAIDAPLVVKNPSGQRPCERQISVQTGGSKKSGTVIPPRCGPDKAE